MKYREGENAAAWRGVLEPILGQVKIKAKPHPTLPYDEIGAFMSELRKRKVMPMRALEFIILTATREGEATGAAWGGEIDMVARIWTISAERMKAGNEHRVQLSDAAVQLQKTIPHISGSRYFFDRSQRLDIAYDD